MANQIIDLGTAPDDGTGDSLRVGGDKVNDNFSEIYTLLGDGTTLPAELEIPVSDTGDPGLHFGAEPSGETGIGIHTGSENRLRTYVQNVEAARFNSGGGIASWAYGSVGSEKILSTDTVYEIELGHPGSSPDRAGIMIFHTPTIPGSNTAAIIYYRSGSNVIEILSQSAAGLITVAGNVVGTGTAGADGYFNITCHAGYDKLYFENRLAGDVAICVMFIGQGSGMTS